MTIPRRTLDRLGQEEEEEEDIFIIPEPEVAT
jgi:hypothetical protein